MLRKVLIKWKQKVEQTRDVRSKKKFNSSSKTRGVDLREDKRIVCTNYTNSSANKM